MKYAGPCFYCGKTTPDFPGDFHGDHFPVPKRNGGTEVVIACSRCHHEKDDGLHWKEKWNQHRPHTEWDTAFWQCIRGWPLEEWMHKLPHINAAFKQEPALIGQALVPFNSFKEAADAVSLLPQFPRQRIDAARALVLDRWDIEYELQDSWLTEET